MIKKNYLIQLDTLMRRGYPADGAVYFLDTLRENKLPFLILTEQSARTRDQTAALMNDVGFHGIRPADIYSSIMAAVDWVLWKEPFRRTAAYLGGPGIRLTLEEVGMTIRHMDADVLFVGMNRNLGYRDYSEAVQIIHDGAVLISTDSRRIQRQEGAEYIGNGAVVKMLEYASGIKALDFGRGSIGLYNMALRYMQVNARDVVSIGTQFPRDIEAARTMGIETVFLTNGASIMELGMDEENHPDYIVEDLYGLTR